MNKFMEALDVLPGLPYDFTMISGTPLPSARGLCAALLAATAFFPNQLHAQSSVTTDPVGFVNLTANAASDATISLPLHRPNALQTTVSSVSGNVITVAATMTASQFVYSSPSQTDHFYIHVRTSANSSVAGNWYQISANDASTLTVVPVVSTTAQTDGLQSGDTVEVIPFWTLNTLFPTGKGIDSTTSLSALQTQILQMPQASAGINPSAQAVYIYYSGPGATAGWYNAGTLTAANDLYFVPDSYLILRNVGSAKTIALTGAVPMGNSSTYVETLAAGKAQDNLLVNPFPVAQTLSQLNLVQSGVITGTTSLASLSDQLLVFSSSSTGYNVAASQVLIYWTGGQGAVNGWYDAGTLAGPLDTTLTIQPGMGFVIRKAASQSASASRWTAATPY
jgi:uncharacterized protein (TIGR02597 family)